jgi:RNA polymerase sigma factor (sigma-70 family)
MTQSAFDIELDEFTLARARRGDVSACETLFRLYNRPAYSIAYRVCQCPQLAQDVTQEAFISAFRRIGQFRGDSPFWGWLRRVVVNHAISALRRQPKTDPVELQEHHAAGPGEQERIGLSMDLETALSKLGKEDRAVVWLHDVEGYNHKEIAKLFDKTESFSKTRLSRARARLRELIDPLMNPASDGGKHHPEPTSRNTPRDTEPVDQSATMLNLSTSF